MKIKYYLTIALAAFSASTQALTDDSLTDFLAHEMLSMDQAFAQSSSQNGPVSPQHNEDWFLRRFWLRLRAKAGVDIPGLAEFDVIPEVEMLWENEVPEGWAIYKP